MKEIRQGTGFTGIDLVKDSNGWYLCAGSYGEKDFGECKLSIDQIRDFAEVIREEFVY